MFMNLNNYTVNENNNFVNIGFIKNNMTKYANELLNIGNNENIEFVNMIINNIGKISRYDLFTFISTYGLCSDDILSDFTNALGYDYTPSEIIRHFGIVEKITPGFDNSILFGVKPTKMNIGTNEMLLYKYNISEISKNITYDKYLSMLMENNISGPEILKRYIGDFVNYLNISRMRVLFNMAFPDNVYNREEIFKLNMSPVLSNNGVLFYKNAKILNNSIHMKLNNTTDIMFKNKNTYIDKNDNVNTFIKNYLKSNLNKQTIIINDKLHQIEKIEHMIKNSKDNIYDGFILQLEKMRESGWDFGEIKFGGSFGNTITFSYKNRIYANGIIVGNEVKEFPDELKKLFYIYDIKIYIDTNHGTIVGGVGKGFYPHLRNGGCEHIRTRQESFHKQSLCLGGLSHAKLDKIANLPSNLELLYYNSMYSCLAEQLIKVLNSSSNKPLFDNIKRIYRDTGDNNVELIKLIEKKYIGCLSEQNETLSKGEIFVA